LENLELVNMTMVKSKKVQNMHTQYRKQWKAILGTLVGSLLRKTKAPTATCVVKKWLLLTSVRGNE